MNIQFSATRGESLVRLVCPAGLMAISKDEARRCLAYLEAPCPHGVLRVTGVSVAIRALWLDRTLEGYLIVHAATDPASGVEPAFVARTTGTVRRSLRSAIGAEDVHDPEGLCTR